MSRPESDDTKDFSEDLFNLNLLFSLILTHPLSHAYNSTCYSLFECLLQSHSPFLSIAISLIIRRSLLKRSNSIHVIHLYVSYKFSSCHFRLVSVFLFFFGRIAQVLRPTIFKGMLSYVYHFFDVVKKRPFFDQATRIFFVGLPLVLTFWRQPKKKKMKTTQKCTAQW